MATIPGYPSWKLVPGYESVPGSYPFWDSIVCIENCRYWKSFFVMSSYSVSLLVLGNFECQLSLQSGFLFLWMENWCPGNKRTMWWWPLGCLHGPIIIKYFVSGWNWYSLNFWSRQKNMKFKWIPEIFLWCRKWLKYQQIRSSTILFHDVIMKSTNNFRTEKFCSIQVFFIEHGITLAYTGRYSYDENNGVTST